jgi:glucose-1-phosphate thymidylyltransferase
LRPSARGELEITDANVCYLEQGRLAIEVLGRGMAWFDAGTPESMLEAAHYVASVERRSGLKIAVPEEIAWRLGYIGDGQLEALAGTMPGSSYGLYLVELLAGTYRPKPILGAPQY